MKVCITCLMSLCYFLYQYYLCNAKLCEKEAVLINVNKSWNSIF